MRLLKFFSALLLIIVYISCKKDSGSVNLTPQFYILNGDTTYFDKNLILFASSDTAVFNVVVSSTYLSSKTVTVSLAADDSYRQSYNAIKGTDYAAMPANAYNFEPAFTTSTSSIYDTIPVTIFKNLLSSSKCMLPIKIASVSDFTIDTSSIVIYLHTDNSELSGIYNSAGLKILYKGNAADSNVNSKDSFALVKNLVPQTNSLSLLDYADLGSNGWQYNVRFSTDDNSFIVTPNDVILGSVQSGSFEVLTASFDAANKDIYIKTRYKNLSGDERIVEESLTLH